MRDVIKYSRTKTSIEWDLTLFMFDHSRRFYEWKNGKTPNMTTRDLNKLRIMLDKGIKCIYYIEHIPEMILEILA